MVDHTKQHANISLCFHRAEKNQKVRIILHLPKDSHFDTNQARKSRNSARFFVFGLKIKRIAIAHECKN